MTIEELRVLITAETSGLRREVNGVRGQMNNLSRSANTATAGIRSAFKKMVAGIVALGIGRAIKSSIKSAMDAIESENLFDTVMGQWTKSVRAWSMELQKDLGLNAYEVRKNVGVLYNMTQSMGIAEKSALDMSKQLTELAYDMGSFYNISNEEAFNKLRAGITGETEPLKRLGILVDENTIKQVAYQKGIAAVGSELNQQQKVMARYMAIMEQTKNAQGDLARTIDSPANQLRVLSTQLDVIKINIGQAFMPIVQIVIPILSNLAKWLVNITSLIAEFSQALFGMGNAQVNQANTAAMATTGQKNLGKATEEAGKKAKGSTAGFDEINKLQQSMPKGSTASVGVETPSNPQAGPSIDTDGMETTKSRMQLLAEEVISVFKNIHTEISDYVGKINDAFSGISPTLEPIRNIGKNIAISFSKIGQTAVKLKDKFLKPLGDYILLKFVPSIATTFTDVFAPIFADTASWSVSEFATIFENATQANVDLLESVWLPSMEQFREMFAEVLPEIGEGFQSLLDNTIKPFVDYLYNEFILPIATALNETLIPIFTDIGVAAFKQFANTFRWAVELINSIYKTILKPVFDLIKDIVLDVLSTVKKLWDKYGDTLLRNIQEFIQGVQDTIQKLWDDVYEPIIKPFLEEVKRLWDEHISVLIEKVGELVMKFANGALEIYNGFIKPLIDWFIENLAPSVTKVINTVVKIIGGIVGTISDVVGDIIDIFGGIIDFISGVFSQDWEKAWKGVKKIFGGIWDTFVDIAKAPLNLIIKAINYVISKMNKIQISIPDWVPKIGGKSFGVDIPEIPMLARGGIVDNPTLAMIGEAGKEAVVPLENTSFVNTLAGALGSAVMNAIQVSSFGGQSSNMNNEDKELVLELDGTELGRVLLSKINTEKERQGVNIFATT